jgi:hypothetical protein
VVLEADKQQVATGTFRYRSSMSVSTTLGINAMLIIDQDVSQHMAEEDSCELTSATTFRSIIYGDCRVLLARAPGHAYLGRFTGWATASLIMIERSQRRFVRVRLAWAGSGV